MLEIAFEITSYYCTRLGFIALVFRLKKFTDFEFNSRSEVFVGICFANTKVLGSTKKTSRYFTLTS